MRMAIGTYQLDIDTVRTAAFYADAAGIACDCDGCRNYAAAVLGLPPEVRLLFQQFGIDPAKPAEVYVNYAHTKETVQYGGFYHICGTIRQGTMPWIKIDEQHFAFDEQYRINLCDGFSVYFTDRSDLIEDGFPMPVIQIEIEFVLPWVMQIPNSYLIPQ